MEEKGIKLDLVYAFGSYGNQGLRDGICYGDEEGTTLVYPAGRYIVFRSIENEEMSFMNLSPNVDKIQAMAVIMERNRRLMALAEHIKTECQAQISIFDLKSQQVKKVRTLQYTETQSEEIIALAWSNDTKILAAVSGAPDYSAVV